MCAMINHFIKQHNVVWTKIVFVHQRLTGKERIKGMGKSPSNKYKKKTSERIIIRLYIRYHCGFLKKWNAFNSWFNAR